MRMTFCQPVFHLFAFVVVVVFFCSDQSFIFAVPLSLFTTTGTHQQNTILSSFKIVFYFREGARDTQSERSGTKLLSLEERNSILTWAR